MQMKHGDKKAKAAKASSKASDKKSSRTLSTSKRKASPPLKKAAAKASKSAAGTAKPKAVEADRAVSDAGTFSNAVVAAAFKRAVKKFSNAFRRLTD
jgi:hypothetical protein